MLWRPPVATTDRRGEVVFGAELYDPDEASGAPGQLLAARAPGAIDGLDASGGVRGARARVL